MVDFWRTETDWFSRNHLTTLGLDALYEETVVLRRRRRHVTHHGGDSDSYGRVLGVRMDNDILKRLEACSLKYHVNMTRVDFDADDDVGLCTDEVVMLVGDCNCWHSHRYAPETGHGFSELSEQWLVGDVGMASLSRVLDRLEALMQEPYDCKDCRKQLKNGG